MAPQVLTVDPKVDSRVDRIKQLPMTTQVVKTNAREDKNPSMTVASV